MLDFYLKGGFLMHPILIASIIALTLVLERIWYFSQIRSPDVVQQFERIEACILKGDEKGAKGIAHQIPGPLGKILQIGLREMNHPPQMAEEQMAINGEAIYREAARGLASLGLIPSVATMLGLLGTVVGLVLAFKKVALLEGNVSPALLASGIWVALITTIAGLSVAIPALIAHHFFQERLCKLTFEIEHFGSRLLLLLKKRGTESTIRNGVTEKNDLTADYEQNRLQVAYLKGKAS